MPHAKTVSKEVLEMLYINRAMTMKEISIELKVSQLTVAKYMKVHGIPVRDVNLERSIPFKLKITEEEFKELLFNEYIVEQKSQNQLSKMFGVTHVIIAKYLEKYKIPIREHTEANKVSNSGSKCNNWSGGRYIASNGYVVIIDESHPRPIRGNYVYEHRHVMEKHIGRYLMKDEQVHHINGNKVDNRIENLELTTNSEHQKKHAKNRIPYMNKKRLEKLALK